MKSTLARVGLAAGAILVPTMLQARDLVFESKSPKASLIELYSSEGCSSCPPAEAWLNNLKSASGLWRDIFPVAFHVNYWDNLGWPDRFAADAYTQRQRDYATRLGQDSVYTPEFVVDGHEWRRGWFSGQIPDDNAGKQGTLTVTVQAEGGKISARYAAPPSLAAEPLTLNIAQLGFNVISDVKRGENGGHRLQHDFVVLGFRSMPLANDKSGVLTGDAVTVPVIAGETPGALVAWISDPNGKIVQITGGWLAKETASK
jgi:hypothetical protein